MEAETRWTLGWSTTLGPRAIAAIAAPGVTKFLGPRASAAIAAPGVTKLLGPRAIAAVAAPGVTKRTHDDQGRAPPPDALHVRSPRGTLAARSEERRVGKECRSRWSPDQKRKNDTRSR